MMADMATFVISNMEPANDSILFASDLRPMCY